MTGFVLQGHICWSAAQEMFHIIIDAENSCAA